MAWRRDYAVCSCRRDGSGLLSLISVILSWVTTAIFVKYCNLWLNLKILVPEVLLVPKDVVKYCIFSGIYNRLGLVLSFGMALLLEWNKKPERKS